MAGGVPKSSGVSRLFGTASDGGGRTLLAAGWGSGTGPIDKADGTASGGGGTAPVVMSSLRGGSATAATELDTNERILSTIASGRAPAVVWLRVRPRISCCARSAISARSRR